MKGFEQDIYIGESSNSSLLWLAAVAVCFATHLKDGEQGVDDAVEVGGGRFFREVEGAAEELHPEEGEDEDEENEEDEQGDDGGDGVHEGLDQAAHGFPVSVRGQQR